MSMEYRVKLTNYAIEQMQETVSYISKVLLSPDIDCIFDAFLSSPVPVSVFLTVLTGRTPDPLPENSGKIIAVIDPDIGRNLLNLHVRSG